MLSTQFNIIIPSTLHLLTISFLQVSQQKRAFSIHVFYIPYQTQLTWSYHTDNHEYKSQSPGRPGDSIFLRISLWDLLHVTLLAYNFDVTSRFWNIRETVLITLRDKRGKQNLKCARTPVQVHEQTMRRVFTGE